MNKKFGVIILAAGKSSRMGRPKQTLLYRDSTFLQRIMNLAIALNCGPVIVVLGAHAKKLQEDHGEVITVLNENWEEGIAGSIHCGVETLQKNFPGIEGTIITVCDQPYLTIEIFQELINKFEQSKLPIIASNYGEEIGTPVLFKNTVFSELLELKGDKGAKVILQKDKERIGLINFPLGKEDIDTQSDYERLLKNELK